MTRTVRGLGVAAVLVLAGCGGGAASGGGATTPEGGGTGGGETVAATYHYGGPAPAASVFTEFVARGEHQFERICSNCHEDGQGIRDKAFTPERMYEQVRVGRGRMRPISPERLPETEIDALMAYLSTIGGVTGLEPPASTDAPAAPASK